MVGWPSLEGPRGVLITLTLSQAHQTPVAASPMGLLPRDSTLVGRERFTWVKHMNLKDKPKSYTVTL